MDLPAGVWVAVVGAVASVAAALISVFAAGRTARVKSEADLLLERFKAEDAKRRRAFELATQESEPLVAALTQA